MRFKGGRAEGKAVIAGLSCRLPKSDNIDEFWNNLINGKDMIGETRWPVGLYDTPPRAGLINGIDKFDAGFFRFTDSEAHNMNPLLRHLFEVSYECITDSGIPLSVLHSNTTGTYTACFIPDNDPLETSRCGDSKYCTTVSMITGHLMNQFRFTGPSATVDTACSSSVSAMEMAVQDLMTGRCQFALVTACNLLLNPSYLQQMSFLGMLSSEGQSRVFDTDAKGYVRAEGVVSILLTRQASLCQRIYCSVIDVKTSCNGYNPDGITFPSKDCQCALMKEIYKRSEIKSDDIAFMELHSTGTPVGDPIEARSVTEAICSTREKPLQIGSVKANMGHSEATAGLASLVKCILAARHGIIPPQINFKTHNPNIEAIKEGKIVVVKEPTELKDGYIGLNSFGFGGANGHVVLKPFKRKRKTMGKTFCLIPVTARTVQEQEAIKNFVSKNKDDVTLMAHLSLSLLSYDVRRQIRGYFISHPNSPELTQRFSNEAPACSELWLCLQDFIWDMLDFNPQLLNNGCFMKSIVQSQVIVKDKIGLKMIMTEALKLPVKPTTANGFVKAIAVMIGIVDCLQAAKVKISGVYGIGLSEIVACYVDNSLTREQCLRVAYIIGQTIEEHSRHSAKDYKIYKVKLSLQEMYCLGPKVKVLTTLSNDSAIIGITNGYADKTLELIHDKGGYYQQLTDGIILYCRLLDSLTEKVKDKLKVIIQEPKMRSGLMKNPKHLQHPDQYVDSSAVSSILNRVVIAHDILQSMPSNVTLINVNLNGVHAVISEESKSINCKPCPVSFLKTLGEIHMIGQPMDVSVFYQSDFPLDVKSPSISSLVRWDHSYSWSIPDWPEFFSRVKDEAVMPYTIDLGDSEGIHTPLATLIYHSWLAISQKTSKDNSLESKTALDRGITFSNLDLNQNTDTVNELLQGAVVQVLQGKQRFAVHNDGIVLFSGNFMLSSEKLELPKIPGYDLDVNENIEYAEDGDLLQKTEILWEDNWLDFINTVLEFNMEYLEGGLIKVMIDPIAVQEEVKDCANVLAVAEKYTGLCKAGSLLVQNSVTFDKPAVTRKSNISDYNMTAVNIVLAYSIQSQKSDKIMVYQGINNKIKTDVLGLVLMTEEDVICKEIPLAADDKWRIEDIEQIIPYLISLFLLSESTEFVEKPRLLICPPIDTVGMYLMALSSEESGISVFTSSYDIETRQMVESTFPFVCVLPGDNLVQSIKAMTQGEGCDVCIKFTSGELNTCIDFIGSGGKFLQCAKPLEPLELEKLQHNKTFILVDVKKAFFSFLSRSQEEIQTLLYEMRDGAVGKLKEAGYPETKGMLYSLDERSHFLNPISITQILNVLDEPGINLTDSFKCLMEADMLAMERLHNVITTKPKDFSLWERVQFDSQNSEDDENDDTLNEAQLASACESIDLKISQPSKDVVIVRVPNVQITLLDDTDGKMLFPPDYRATSTPMVTLRVDKESDDLHESYIDIPLSDNSIMCSKKESLVPKLLPPQAMIVTPVPDKRRKKSRPMDLVFINSPGMSPGKAFTPITPSIRSLLTPAIKEPSLVPLNSSSKHDKPLYIVHPITGKVTLLKTLGGLLNRQCYGIQRTTFTPRDSLSSVASYYTNAVQMLQTTGSYIIAGYSFGSMVALEMALQLQANKKKVEKLILFDGGPDYFSAQFRAAQKAAKDDSELDLYLEIGALVNFLMMFVPVPSIQMLQNILHQLPNQEARIQTVVEMSFKNVEICMTTTKTKWLSAKEKLFSKMKGAKQDVGKCSMADAAQEVLSWKRREQAADFIKSVNMVNKYKNKRGKFQGDIHLLRIKSDPVMCEHLPVDYGLQSWCTGKVHITFYNGSHETFLNRDSGKEVAEEITKILSLVK
ncbi:fatty acid synthase-like [Mytilus edulis]|uniref:fatty acid synthase-like n=1 Tax=Mytilus edulis TaxID=6550 RepID=UPI0039EFC00E